DVVRRMLRRRRPPDPERAGGHEHLPVPVLPAAADELGAEELPRLRRGAAVELVRHGRDERRHGESLPPENKKSTQILAPSCRYRCMSKQSFLWSWFLVTAIATVGCGGAAVPPEEGDAAPASPLGADKPSTTPLPRAEPPNEVSIEQWLSLIPDALTWTSTG